MADRTVHARYPGLEIVRYDRAGKWYFEPIDSSLPRQKVTVKQAADAAVWARGYYDEGAHIFLGKAGGTRFDHLVQHDNEIILISAYEEGRIHRALFAKDTGQVTFLD